MEGALPAEAKCEDQFNDLLLIQLFAFDDKLNILSHSSTQPHFIPSLVHFGNHGNSNCDECLMQLWQLQAVNNVINVAPHRAACNSLCEVTSPPSTLSSAPDLVFFSPSQPEDIFQIPESSPSSPSDSAASDPPYSPSRDTSTRPQRREKRDGVSKRDHTRSREFACSHCPCTFWRKQDAQRHEATHAVTKQFACLNKCGKSFARKDALGRHMKSLRCRQRVRAGSQ